MAEQEACTELVEKASQEQATEAIEGESLLIPLLQGLLEAPECEQIADSGTESGEDQRSGLIAEVQNALEKLTVSLRSDATDITPERRSSLLHLVTKLQSGLASTTPKLERRLSSGPGRFNRRRTRQNRHTVGVSSEELADARKLMEEIAIHDLTPSSSQYKVQNLEKQNSESSVTSNSSFNKFIIKQPVKNATAKPFNSSSNSISNASSSVQTPTEPSENLENPFAEEATFYEAPPVQMRDKKPNYVITHSTSITSLDQEVGKPRRPLSESISLDLPQEVDTIRTVHKAVQQAAARKKGNSESAADTETEEDDTSTVRDKEKFHEMEGSSPSPFQENPAYVKPEQISSESSPSSYEDRVRRFDTTSRKLKVKRSNTIDIPKAHLLYADEDSDYSDMENDEQQTNNNFLRGLVSVKTSVPNKIVPTFQPKTESDQKFLAFLNKNNENVSGKANPWAPTNKTSMWGNKFGNIKNNFEKVSQTPQNNTAKSFWKTQDDATSAGMPAQFGPRISRRSARNLQQMFEEKQKSTQEKLASNKQQHVVTGTLRVQSGLPKEPNNIVTGSLNIKTPQPDRNYKFVQQPAPVNKFSHAPQSAFKPIPKREQPKLLTLKIEPNKEILKTEIIESKNDPPLYLYSPKPLLTSQSGSSASSPVIQSSKPWVTNATEHGGRVLSMAAKKFEHVQEQPDSFQLKPRKLSKDINKVFVTQPKVPEKMSAPYLVKTADQNTNTVRKLSGQYDSFNTSVSGGEDKKSHYVPNYAIPNLTQKNVVNQHQKYNNPQSPIRNYSSNVKQSYQPQKVQQHFVQPRQYSTNNIYDKSGIGQQTEEFQPINYSITYDKPHIDSNIKLNRPEKHEIPPTKQPINGPTQQIFQHVPGREIDQPMVEQVAPLKQTPKKQNQVPVQAIEPVVQPPKLETQLSSDSVHEYTAISSKVMTGPVSQQAVTVKQKSPMSRNQHDMEAAFQLKNVLQKVNKTDAPVSPNNSRSTKQDNSSTKSPNNSFKYKANVTQIVTPNNSFKYNSINQSQPQSIVKPTNTQDRFNKYHTDEPININNTYNKYNPSDVPKPAVAISNLRSRFEDSSKLPQSETTKTFGVVKPMQQKQPSRGPIYNNVSQVQKPLHSVEINDKGQSVLTSRFHIPVINVAPSSPGVNFRSHGQALSKSDSWHQICMAQQAQQRPLSSDSSAGRMVRKSKSSHSLAVPQKQFEAGMSKDELLQKKKTVESYFSGDSKSPSPQPDTTKNVKRSINRIKTSAKASAYRQSSSTGVMRSRTLPDLVCPELLDESNVDEAFDELFKSSS